MTSPRSSSSTGWIFWGLVIGLALLHHDLWFWDDRTLVFGFLPIGLAYHALFSIAAASAWAIVITVAWPRHIEEWADEFENAGSAPQATQAPQGRSA